MNVKYEDFNTVDVAKILGVARCTLTWWVREGHIKAQDVAEPGSKLPRYLFTDAEVTRVQNLIKKYGRENWKNHSSEGLIGANPVAKAESAVIKVKEPVDVNKAEADQITTTILRIRDLKARLEQLDAERNQIAEAIEVMKKQVIDAI